MQLLDENCQEEEDFMSGNNFANATALSHSKNHNLLPLQLVQLSAVSTKEALWVEGRWIFPLPSVERDMCGNKGCEGWTQRKKKRKNYNSEVLNFNCVTFVKITVVVKSKYILV